MRGSLKRTLPPLALLLVGLLGAFHLWGPGIVNTRGGGDSPFLLSRTLEMAENLRHGHFPPRWMAHAAYDLGYPFFNHYAALPYYLSGGLTALGLSPLVAIQATQTLGFLLAALTMALWARRLFDDRLAVALAAVAYTFAPFHLVNVYVRGDSLSEFYAFVWYPLILWALDRLAERATPARVVVASLAYGALILTHNVSALIFSPFALLYAVVAQAPRARPGGLPASLTTYGARIALPFALGILLTAWFWLPAIAETGYGQMGPEFTAGYFSYDNHFRGANLVQGDLTFDYAIAGTKDEAGPFAMGLVQAVLAALGVIYCVLRIAYPETEYAIRNTEYATRNTQHATCNTNFIFLLIGLALSTLMITPLSRPLWEHLPLLATTQFPWRFLSVQALFTAAVTGALASRRHGVAVLRSVPGTTAPVIRWAVAVVAGSALVLAALSGLRPDRLRIDAEDVTWGDLLLYETFTGNIGTTIRHEYLPAAVVPRPYTSEAVVRGVGRARPLVPEGVRLEAEPAERTPERQAWRVALDGAAPVTFPLHWWPGWRAWAGGREIPAYPVPGSGRLAVDLAAGEHLVELELRNTPLRTAAELLSLATLVAGGAVLTATYPGRPRGEGALPATLVVAATLALSLAPPALLARPVGEARFFDFVQMPYPHAGPVDFGRATLEGVAAPESVAPGGRARVSLCWSDLTLPLTGTLRLVSPAAPRHGAPYLLAESPFAPAKGETTVDLDLPEGLGPGPYLLEVRLRGPEGELFGRTEEGRGMGPLYAGAVRVVEGDGLRGTPPLAELGDGELLLHDVVGTQQDPGNLRLAMTWSTPGTPRNWTLSLRLRDAAGKGWAQVDFQPGYGYLPTTLWNGAGAVTDYPTLPLPEGLAPGEYTLEIITYLEGDMQGGGSAQVPVTLTQATRREPTDEEALCRAGELYLGRVEGLEGVEEGQDLELTAWWGTFATSGEDLRARWTLLDPREEVVAEVEGPLAPGSNAATWPPHAWVRALVPFELPPVLPEGPYRLRLTLLDGAERTASCVLPRKLPVELRPRAFALPGDLPHPLEADFEGVLRLRGYEIRREGDALTLTLWWQAGATSPQRDLKRFVHLYDPATGAIAAQSDAMPRDWSYPTSWWVAEEVVSETVTLEVGDQPGGEYRLGVGWYAPEDGTPLAATDGEGRPVPDDRVVLTDLRLP